MRLAIMESAPVSSTVGRVFAKDLDEGINAEMKYRIVDGDGADAFDINTDPNFQVGIITVKKVTELLLPSHFRGGFDTGVLGFCAISLGDDSGCKRMCVCVCVCVCVCACVCVKVVMCIYLCSHSFCLFVPPPPTTSMYFLCVKKQLFVSCFFRLDCSSFSWELFFALTNAMAPHSSTLAWKIPWTEEPGRL